MVPETALTRDVQMADLRVEYLALELEKYLALMMVS